MIVTFNTCNLQRQRAKMTKVIIAVVDIGRKVVTVVEIAYTIRTCKTTATRPAATANVSEIQNTQLITVNIQIMNRALKFVSALGTSQ